MKRALIIRHVPYEGVAGFREPIAAAGYQLDRIDVGDPGFADLDLREPDLLIMMGGPMGVYEQQRYPWLAGLLRRLGCRLAADRPTLGVCLGAQMIAAALGARVYPGPVQEIGFHAVTVLGPALDGPLRHIAGVPMLHWHGDTFTLPAGAELLASSHLYAHQAFRRGSKVLALQFHGEMGEDERFAAWLTQSPAEVIAAGHDPAGLQAMHDRLGPGAVAAGRAMIAQWLTQLR